MSSQPPPRIPIWVDCDPGSLITKQDAFAILLATNHPTIHLLGISTVHGNSTLKNTTRNALTILTILNRPDIPVYPGAEKPFCRTCLKPDNGKTGLEGSNLPVPTTSPEEKHAVLAMRDALLSTPKHTAWLVALGPLTNVALLVGLFPEVAGHVRGVSIMGGAVGGGFVWKNKEGGEEGRMGNASWWAEFNCLCDPESARAVFSNKTLVGKITLLPLDITHMAMVTDEVLDLMLHGPDGNVKGKRDVPSERRRIFTDLLRWFRAGYKKAQNIDGPLHDPLAVAVILHTEGVEDIGFEFLGEERFEVELVLEGEQVGRTVVRRLPDGEMGVRIPRVLDVQSFWRVLERAVALGDE
ncbi:nucleoside hydrolase [Aspergillus sclerotioniger CBS 115572]|uniref:Nucleoside hydrolase n=1 Tax=Aspergillus sclerotioniger CBS 115572 TaxID=1450535 RepID=A0A317X5S5_9EURO|nr:nucleoside hydrolase [Aspergillus sclerotioniger CBS 115572]PWY93541.1 nucleoside hydrolase [Aspergillus sclerotioniger CBS 115572]